MVPDTYYCCCSIVRTAERKEIKYPGIQQIISGGEYNVPSPDKRPLFTVLLYHVSATAVECYIPLYVRTVAKKRYQAVGFPCNRMLELSSSRGIRIDVPMLSVSWSFEDYSVIIQALRIGLIEHEASDTGGVPRWKSSCPDRLAEATISRKNTLGYK